MNVKLIGKNIINNTNQGISVYGVNLYNMLKNMNVDVNLINVLSKNKYGFIFDEQVRLPYLTTSKGDIFHLLAPEYGSILSLLKHKTLVTIHDMIPYIISERSEFFNWYYRYCCNLCKSANKIIAVSNATKQDIIKYLNIDENKIEVIYHGVDHNIFYPKEKSLIEKKIFKIGYIGGLGKRKNVDLLIKSMSNIICFNNNVKLIIGGMGPQKDNLEKLVNDLKLSQYVEFRGFIKNEHQNDFYNELDLFVFPSMYEGFGFPVLEAMSAGVPIITSDSSSLPEIIGNNKYVFENNNLQSLTEKICYFIDNKDKLKYVSEELYTRSKLFTWAECAKHHKYIYDNIE